MAMVNAAPGTTLPPTTMGVPLTNTLAIPRPSLQRRFESPGRSKTNSTSVAATMSDAGESPLGLELRIGIATGEVLVDQARASSERDLFVTGDAVNTAARLQAAAEPGTVLVGSTTYAATREAIDYEELAPVALKGKELPVAVWRAVSVRAGRGGRRARRRDRSAGLCRRRRRRW